MSVGKGYQSAATKKAAASSGCTPNGNRFNLESLNSPPGWMGQIAAR